MWRAFFYAIGATLILLGAQCLVVDHIVIVNGTRVPGFVARFLDELPQDKTTPLANVSPGTPQSGWGSQNGPTRFPANSGIVSPSGSQFGPSRFDSQFDNSGRADNSHLGGGQPPGFARGFNNQQHQWPQQPNQPFSLAGYGGLPNANSASPGISNSGNSVTLGAGGSRVIKPKDWMPWFLLAIGTLVVLYTNSTSRRLTND